MYDIIIVGIGPAGITAGIYAQRNGLRCLLIGKSLGGQMTSKAVDIENYPGFDSVSGFDLINKMSEQLEGKGVKIIEDEVVKIDKGECFKVFLSRGEEYESKVVIIATGLEARKLEAKGEDEFLGKGVSYCTTCDGPLFKNKDVMIVGGGDAGFEAARFFINKANRIYLLERGGIFVASKKNQEIVESYSSKIQTFINAEVVEVKGRDFLETVKCVIEGEEKEISVNGLFIQIGYVAKTDFVRHLVDLNEKNEIIVDRETLKTRTPGLFAAGDITNTRIKQIITACSDGARASVYAYKYLNNNK